MMRKLIVVRGTTVVMWFSPVGLCTKYYATSYGSDQCHANKRSETKNEADGTKKTKQTKRSRRNKTKREGKEDEESSKDETDNVTTPVIANAEGVWQSSETKQYDVTNWITTPIAWAREDVIPRHCEDRRDVAIQ